MDLKTAKSGIGLIVNADDFGLSHGVNDGIMLAHRQGIVTSASLMVRRPGAAGAAARARMAPALSVGLHFDLGEWVCRDGEWSATQLTADPDDAVAVQSALDDQLEIFENLVGRPPTHLDSHQHVHRSEPVRSVLSRAAETRGIPLRDVTAGVRYAGEFYGQSRPGTALPEHIEVPALLGILESLPPGITELGCHPGLGTDIPSEYSIERRRETETLCDSVVRRRIAELDIELISFRDLQAGVMVL